jgi:hypothetical protein
MGFSLGLIMFYLQNFLPDRFLSLPPSGNLVVPQNVNEKICFFPPFCFFGGFAEVWRDLGGFCLVCNV